MDTPDQSLVLKLKQRAHELGFDACGVADARLPIDPEKRFDRWLDHGFHADMDWMARTQAIRNNPLLKLPGAQSMVVLAKNYFQESPPLPHATGQIARYAWGRDYHNALRKPLRRLARYLESQAPGAQCVLSIDTGPFLERAWAARAGLGWIGKNGMLISQEFGSWCVLATLLTTVALPCDKEQANRCGACRACIDACPTQAIQAEALIDSRRCIAYHSIENRGSIPPAIAEKMETRIFGCDRCQEVCPWNRRATATEDPDFQARPEVIAPSLQGLAELTEAEFEQRFSGSPVRRAKHAGFLRNIAIALRNRDSTEAEAQKD